MAVDIAKLGIEADTSDVEKATVKLNKLRDAASGVSSAASKMETVWSSGTSKINKAINIPFQDIINKNTGVTKAFKNLAAESAYVFQQEFKNKIPRDLMPNRFNTANIAAQFQDIGVTAAMGMNPLTIALQQGTQVAAIMNSMEKPLQGIGQAFKSIINPISLMSMGLVGLVAALIQFVDWTSVGKTMLNGLADAIEVALPYVVQFGIVMALAFAPSIVSGIFSVTKAIVVLGWQAVKTGAQMAAAWVMANPLTALAAGFLAITLLLINFNETTRKVVNQIIGFFVALGKTMYSTFTKFPAVVGDAMISAANHVLQGTVNMINKTIEAYNNFVYSIGASNLLIGFKAQIQEVPNIFKGAMASVGDTMREELSKTEGFDYIGEGMKKLKEFSSNLANKLRSVGGATEEVTKKSKELKDVWLDLRTGAEKDIAALQLKTQLLGESAYQTAYMEQKTKLLNDALEKHVTLSELDNKYNMTKGEVIEMLSRQYADATEDYNLQNAALQKQIDTYNSAKSTFQGFFTSLRSSLSEGTSLWESFGNSVMNVLNKLLDKILDVGSEMLFSGLFGDGSKGSSGLLGTVGGLLSSIGFANGGAFNNGLQTFAKGGSFTNGIVNRPTPFMFANGGSLGVMGEAGPEAILPLQRSSDGSLGVRSNGGGNGGNVFVNVTNNSGATASVRQRQTAQGIELDVLVDETVSQKMSEQGTATNRAMTAFNSRQLIRR